MIKRSFALSLSCLVGLVLLGSLGYFAKKTPAAFADDFYYVDAVIGSNTTGDGSQTAPWQTVSFALSQISVPDVEIHVAAGVYDSALGESFPIVMKPDVSLIGAGREDTVLYGDGVSDVVYFPETGFFTSSTVIQGFKIMNGDNGILIEGSIGIPPSPVVEDNWITGNVIGINNDSSSDQKLASVLSNNQINNNTTIGIYLFSGNNGSSITSIISENEITNNGTSGIYCHARGAGSSGNSDNSHCNVAVRSNLIAYNGGEGFRCRTYYAGECRATISDNYFISNGSWGVSRSHNGTYIITNRPVFVDNVFVGNGSGGAEFRNGDQPTFVNNTLAYNSQYGIRSGTPTVINSIVWGHSDDLNVAAQYVSYSNIGDSDYEGINNNLSIDPEFADPAQNDLHIAGNSPMVDAGNSGAANIPAFDVDGDTRILGAAVDIGADETTDAYLIAIEKSAVPTTSVTIDDVISYTISVVNSGPASAAGVQVTDTIPAPFTVWDGYLNASTGSATVSNGVLYWSVGTLFTGISETIEYTVRVNPQTPLNSYITNTADVGGPIGAITTSLPVTNSVGPGYYWEDSSQSVNHIQALAGEMLTYTIYLLNGGNITAAGVAVTDTLDTEVAFMTANNGGVLSNGLVVWSGLTVAAGETLTLTAVVSTTAPIPPGYIVHNQVIISGEGLTFQPPDVSTYMYNPAQAAFDAAPKLGPAPLSVNFFNQSQYANSFVWDYGDGNESTMAGDHTHVYQNSGIYSVTLTAVNPVSSQQITHTRFITVYDMPVSDFTAVPTVGGTPLLVEFTNNSLYSGQYVWDYGDGITSTVASLTHTHLYSDAGFYDVTLTASNAYTASVKSRNNYIAVYDDPEADFSGTPTEGVSPLLVNFTNESTDATTYLWDFGDGSTSTAANPSHTFWDVNQYTVTLTASNPVAGDIVVKSAYITVHQPPVASFIGSPLSGFSPLTVSFTNLSNFADSFVWDYGDGSISTTSAQTHQHVYQFPGVYTVQLTAINAYGSDSFTRINYIAVHDAPVPDFTAVPTSGVEPLMVQFTNLSQNGSSYLWTFGDGSTSAAVSPSHIYQNGGVYTVTLKATNPGGSVYLTRTDYITVYEAPEPSFTAEPRVGFLTLTTTFTNTSLYADSYIWDYGDGSTSTTSLPVHVHNYTAPGIYDVTLTAVNAYGSNDWVEIEYITVFDAPQADFTAQTTLGQAPLNVSFTNQSQYGSSFIWSFGDGSSSTATNPAHTYSTAGVYTVTLTATNPYGSNTLTRAEYITVYDGAVAAFEAVPRIGEAPLVVTFTNQSLFADTLIWGYGDGQSQVINDIQHTHTYTIPGTYTVTLTAVNAYDSQTVTRTHYIAVMPPGVQPAYFVDALSGSNVTGDGSKNNPWQTITYGFSQVDQPDVTIYVASGLYNNALGESFPIIMEPGVSLIGAHPTAAIIKGPGSGIVIHFPNSVAYPDTTLIQGFKITSGTYGVEIDGATGVGQLPVIDGNWITGNTDGIRTYVSGSWRYLYATISHNVISNNSRYGIYDQSDSYNGSGKAYNNPLIVGNVIAYNNSDGIYCYAYGWSSFDRGYSSPEITGNEIVGNGSNGVRAAAGYAGITNFVMNENIVAYNQSWGVRHTQAPLSGATTRPNFYNNLILGNFGGGLLIHKEDEVELVNNTVVNNGGYGIRRENSGIYDGYIHVANSIVWGNGDNLNNINANWVSYSDLGDGEYSGTNNNISTDPMFVNPGMNDFHLLPESPVIDKGDSSRSDLPLIDIDGNVRVWGQGVDMGADEVIPELALVSELSANPDPVASGGHLTFTIVVTNTGSNPLDLTITDMLPAEVLPSGPVEWNTFINPGEAWQQQLSVTVSAGFSGQLLNHVDFFDPGGLEVSEFLTTTVLAPPSGLVVTSNSPTLLGSGTQFTATVMAGTGVAYTWAFGDGIIGYGSTPLHTYSVTGTYDVVITGTNIVGSVSTTTTVMVIAPVTAGFAATPTTGIAPLSVQFTNLSSGSFDSCLWDFGDGSSSTSCADPAHVYSITGTFTVSLTISGPGGVDTMIQPDAVTVYQAGAVNFSADVTTGLNPLAVTFENLSTGSYTTCQWVFGDGGTSNECDDPLYTYTAPGIYSVTLTINGPGGMDSLLRENFITVYESAVADFSAAPTTGSAPLIVSFENLSTGDYDTCLWDFGDGESDDDCNNPAHTYMDAGTFTVSLSVSGDGGTDTLTKNGFIVVEGYSIYLPIVINSGPANFSGLAESQNKSTYFRDQPFHGVWRFDLAIMDFIPEWKRFFLSKKQLIE